MKHINPGRRLSGAVLAGGTLYISGQVADDASAPLDVQARQVLGKIDHFLAEAGLDHSNLAMVNIYLPNIMDFDAMNEVYDTWLTVETAPARATIEARLANPDLRIEISAIACQG